MIKKLALDKYSAVYLLGFFILVFGAARPDTFLTWTSLKTVLTEQVALYGVLAIAFLIPLATGTYDLSIGTLVTMSLVIVNWFAKNTDLPEVVGMLIGLGACAFTGLISGFVVVRLRVNSFIATLGMSQIITAFIYFTSEQTISGELSKSYQKIGTHEIIVPMYVWYLLILAIITWFVLEHMPVGRYMFATGGNPEAARLAGVRTDRLVWGSLVASGLVAGFAGIAYSWKVGTYGPNIGPGWLFPAIAAVFFGASQLKGRPNVWGAMLALFALATGIKGIQLTFSGKTRWIEPLFTGMSLIGAVSLASRNAVIKVPKRKQATGETVALDRADAGAAPVEATT
jgi:ribose transport system permease protein